MVLSNFESISKKQVTTAIIALEICGLGGTYFVWRRLKSSSDFRYSTYNNYFPVLKFFYVIYGQSKAEPAITLNQDIEKWKSEGKRIRKRCRGWQSKRKQLISNIQKSKYKMNPDTSISDLKERKLLILSQKNEARRLKQEEKKHLKTKDVPDDENIGLISLKFEQLNEEVSSILKQIEDAVVPKESLPELFDSCYCKLEEWQKTISLSSHILKISHKKQLLDKYHTLNNKRQKLEKCLMPEEKFVFKKLQKKNEIKKENDPPVEPIDEVDAAVRVPVKKFSVRMDGDFEFQEKENENFKLVHDQIYKKEVTFRNLKNCRVSIEGGASTIYFASLTDCRVLCGPVSTSIFIDDCKNCVFVVACQQLRVHNTQDVDFYLHVTSRAIIEDSEKIRFCPYNWKYASIEKHFELAGLDSTRNNWNLIDDFNWLSSEPSPHWKILEDDERIKEWQ